VSSAVEKAPPARSYRAPGSSTSTILSENSAYDTLDVTSRGYGMVGKMGSVVGPMGRVIGYEDER
jgi:hypothetical protein